MAWITMFYILHIKLTNKLGDDDNTFSKQNKCKVFIDRWKYISLSRQID